MRGYYEKPIIFYPIHTDERVVGERKAGVKEIL
jgi:hypothetical protein